uniref:uncharacterized protein LOC128930350 n=1 Tax=Callithrix jacchus TaxID=9483 RepID=UPI0023DCED22|nr:uncharacterized protein LOC128930350 [Callithrix jacchus]XP_054104967.1 uncharacterized protein LOC128930350 [Callithrix jacchus]XP_054104968.1 uncharacterized protein LOC128930350 [Callithrix jacchus]
MANVSYSAGQCGETQSSLLAIQKQNKTTLDSQPVSSESEKELEKEGECLQDVNFSTGDSFAGLFLNLSKRSILGKIHCSFQGLLSHDAVPESDWNLASYYYRVCSVSLMTCFNASAGQLHLNSKGRVLLKLQEEDIHAGQSGVPAPRNARCWTKARGEKDLSQTQKHELKKKIRDVELHQKESDVKMVASLTQRKEPEWPIGREVNMTISVGCPCHHWTPSVDGNLRGPVCPALGGAWDADVKGAALRSRRRRRRITTIHLRCTEGPVGSRGCREGTPCVMLMESAESPASAGAEPGVPLSCGGGAWGFLCPAGAEPGGFLCPVGAEPGVPVSCGGGAWGGSSVLRGRSLGGSSVLRGRSLGFLCPAGAEPGVPLSCGGGAWGSSVLRGRSLGFLCPAGAEPGVPLSCGSRAWGSSL